MGNLLKGKVAIVTGSGQGVGRAVAIALADEGAKVITNNRAPVSKNKTNQLDDAKLARLSREDREWLDEELEKLSGDAETTAAAIRAMGGEATPCYGDIADYNAAKAIVDKAVEVYGTVDIVVNAAGSFGFAPIEKITEELWDKVTASKPKGFFNVIRHAVPYMKKNGWGRILNCISVAFLGNRVRHAEYCAANAGAVGLTRGLAWELFEDGITVNTFAPTARTRASLDMQLFNKTVDEDAMSTKDGTPLAMYNDTPLPELFAPFIAWLVSDEAKDVTGTVFHTSGGTIRRYSDPAVVAEMKNPGGWTVEDVMKTAPETLFKDYKSIVKSSFDPYAAK